MQYRTLGKTGWQVSEISHGTWAMGSMWGARNDAQALQALQKGLDCGINFIDTAFLYGQGHSERLIGQLLKKCSTPPKVATKCPPQLKSWPPKPGSTAQEAFAPEHLIQTTEQSLKNLGVECLDLQQLHVWRSEWLAESDWQEAVAQLKAQGKIQYFGVSLNDHEPNSGLALVESGLVDTIQVIFNLFDQSAREQLFPACQKHQVGVLVRVPLDEGGLTGQLKPGHKFSKGDWRARYFQGDRLKQTWDHLQEFQFLQRGKIQSPSQAALKFCLSEPAVSTVIVGMRQVEHVRENTKVSDFDNWTPDELSQAHALAWPRNFYPKMGW